MFQYPYGDTQQLNLDWLMEQWQETKASIDGSLQGEIDRVEAAITDLLTARDQAVAAQTAAETAATSASGYAGTASGAASTATAQATAAAASAALAGTHASNAQTSETNAGLQATAAGNSASASAVSATNARNSELAAAASSSAAAGNALYAEGMAKGTQNGTPVTSGSPYYEDNSAYWAGEAQVHASNAVAAAYYSEAMAKGTVNGTPVASGEPGYEDNAEYYKDQAAAQAAAAAASAASADGAAAQAMIAQVESSSTASAAHAAGTYFRLNGVLYMATQDIAVGATITPGTNCSVTVLGNDVSELKTAIDPALASGNDSCFWLNPGLDVTSNGVRRYNLNGKLRLSGTATATRYLNYYNGCKVNGTTSSTFLSNIKAGSYVAHISITGKVTNVAVRYTYSTFADGISVSDGSLLKLTQDAEIFVVQQNNTNYGNLSNNEYTLIDITFTKLDSVYDMIENISEENSDIQTYTNFVDGYYVSTETSPVDITSPISSSAWEYIVVPCASGDRFVIEALGGTATRLTYCFITDAGTIVSSSGEVTESAEYTIKAYEAMKEVVCPSWASKLLVNHHKKSMFAYSPKVYKLSKNENVNYLARRVTGKLPYKPVHEWENKVIAAYKHMIAIEDNGIVKFSKDDGKTWNAGVDISALGISATGTIRHAHIYENGCLGFFTDTKAYYIESTWDSYNEASCYEANGSAYTPSDAGNFNAIYDHAQRKFIDNQDMFVFNNYNADDTLRKLVWYSVDNGHSYKIAYEFDLVDTYPARHIHDTIYYSTEDVFITCTGDSNATECRVCALTYDSTEDSWSIESLGGSSRDYKWGNITIRNGMIYYTYDSTPGKIMKCSYDDIGDVSKHITILDGMESDAVGIVVSPLGEIIATQSEYRSTGNEEIPIPFTRYQAARILYYSPDGNSFHKLILPLLFMNGVVVPNKTCGLTTDGRCFIYGGKRTSLSIDDFLHTQGFPNALKVF